MEVKCWRCSAVFVPEATAGRCPHCGYNFQTPFVRLRLAIGSFLGPTGLLAYGLYLLRDGGLAAIILLGGSIAWAWSIYTEKSARWFHKPIIALGLEDQNREAGSLPFTSDPIGGPTRPAQKPRDLNFATLSKPTIPDNWRALAIVPCPRELSSTLFSHREVVLTVGLILELVFILGQLSRDKLMAFFQHPGEGIWDLLFPAILALIIVRAIREASTEREALRDGLLTVGVITNWIDGKRGASIDYQFWTDSGEKFEGHGRLVSKEDLSILQEPLKVFYLPHNPAKNVALCCTALRVITR